jgi:hypothetical protein
VAKELQELRKNDKNQREELQESGISRNKRKASNFPTDGKTNGYTCILDCRLQISEIHNLKSKI